MRTSFLNTALICCILLVFGSFQALAQTCRWDGTAPFCDGSCGGGETELTRLGSIPDFWTAPFVNSNPPFGSNCTTGSKALCCHVGGGSTCRWDGTAPFCDGSCRRDETKQNPPPGSSSGNGCLTGDKAYCCHTNASTGTVGSRLEASPEYTRYAAFWDKSPGPAWQARHGLSSADYQKAFDDLLRQGYRLVEVSGYTDNDNEAYAAIWEQRQGPAWTARHGLTFAQHQQEFDKLVGQGYRPLDVSGYTVQGQDRYASVWEKSAGPPWVARHGLTSTQYQQEFDRLIREGYRLVDISGYTVGGEDRYAAIWEKREGPAWVARNGMTSAQYQQEFNTFSQQNYRLVRVRGWSSGSSAHFAAIWEQTDGPPWVARHGMQATDYQEQFDKLAKGGYRLKHVSGYHID